MKVHVTMKTPDALEDAIFEAAAASVEMEGLTEEERADLADQRARKAGEIAAKWFRYGELITVEIDTESETCIVMPVT